MNSEDGQVFSVCICSQNINKQNVNNSRLQITAFSVGITILNQRIIHKDDIEFVTEFLCLLGHPYLALCFFFKNKLAKLSSIYTLELMQPLDLS